MFDRHRDIDAVLVALGVLGEPAEDQLPGAVEVISTNFVGAVSGIVPAVERLVNQGHGTLIVLSSVAAVRARQANYPYGATKAGLDAFAQGLGDALRPAGVHVLVVRPGFVRTKMTADRPAAPLSTNADAVATDIVAGLRRRAHTVWSPPVLRFVFGVMRHLPRALWRRLHS